MNNHDFLLKYIELQTDIMYNQVLDLGYALVTYSRTDTSPFWNLSITDKVLSVDQLLEIENIMTSLERTPTVYFENTPTMKPLKTLLKRKGYATKFEDSWMFYENSEKNKSKGLVRKVTNDKELKIFLEVFNNCYQLNDPQNPYGTLGDYLKVAEKVWHKFHDTNRVEYFIAFKGNKPVAVSSLTNWGVI